MSPSYEHGVEHPERRRHSVTSLLRLGSYVLGSSVALTLGVYGMTNTNATMLYGDPGLSRLVTAKASAIYEEETPVVCENFNTSPIRFGRDNKGAGGYTHSIPVPFTETALIRAEWIHLNTPMCETLSDIPQRSAVLTTKQALAMVVLDHEKKHIGGTLSESTAHCYSLQTLPELLRRRGFVMSEEVERSIAQYLFRADTPYYSAECREGGFLDMTPKRDDPDDWLQAKV